MKKRIYLSVVFVFLFVSLGFVGFAWGGDEVYEYPTRPEDKEQIEEMFGREIWARKYIYSVETKEGENCKAIKEVIDWESFTPDLYWQVKALENQIIKNNPNLNEDIELRKNILARTLSQQEFTKNFNSKDYGGKKKDDAWCGVCMICASDDRMFKCKPLKEGAKGGCSGDCLCDGTGECVDNAGVTCIVEDDVCEEIECPEGCSCESDSSNPMTSICVTPTGAPCEEKCEIKEAYWVNKKGEKLKDLTKVKEGESVGLKLVVKGCKDFTKVLLKLQIEYTDKIFWPVNPREDRNLGLFRDPSVVIDNSIFVLWKSARVWETHNHGRNIYKFEAIISDESVEKGEKIKAISENSIVVWQGDSCSDYVDKSGDCSKCEEIPVKSIGSIFKKETIAEIVPDKTDHGPCETCEWRSFEAKKISLLGKISILKDRKFVPISLDNVGCVQKDGTGGICKKGNCEDYVCDDKNPCRSTCNNYYEKQIWKCEKGSCVRDRVEEEPPLPKIPNRFRFFKAKCIEGDWRFFKTTNVPIPWMILKVPLYGKVEVGLRIIDNFRKLHVSGLPFALRFIEFDGGTFDVSIELREPRDLIIPLKWWGGRSTPLIGIPDKEEDE